MSSEPAFTHRETKDSFYDCILVDNKKVWERLLSEWLHRDKGFYLGPFKIRIGDRKLYKQLSPILLKLFERIGKQYPDDIWMFSQGNKSIEHPTIDALSKWLDLT